MKKIFLDLLENIPDYQCFLTVDEMDEHSRNLAKQYPDVVSVRSIGETKEGRELLCLTIGSGSKNALMFGCPHPNEPIGTMMLEYFTEQLAANKELRDELDYTWYVVKAWDADGLEKNKRWLKGPFNIYNYSRYFFRPAGHQQVEWTFPVDYKELHFDRTIPETKVMMKLIDEVKPHFMYSLHNAGFGGVYWYISGELPALYDAMYGAANRVNVPLNLGEPETPWCELYAPAVYKALGIEQDYDYMEKYGEENIPEKIDAGNCSDSYARGRYGTFTLLTELPYFYDARIMDQTPSGKRRKDCVLEKLDKSEEHNAYIKNHMKVLKSFVSEDNQYLMAIEAFTKDYGQKSMRKMAETDPEYDRPATVAEEFDNTVIAEFYRLLTLGMVIGMCEHELEKIENKEGLSAEEQEKVDILQATMKEVEVKHRQNTDVLEQTLNYEVIPIKKLVSIQLECGLLVSDYLNNKKPLIS